MKRINQAIFEHTAAFTFLSLTTRRFALAQKKSKAVISKASCSLYRVSSSLSISTLVCCYCCCCSSCRRWQMRQPLIYLQKIVANFAYNQIEFTTAAAARAAGTDRRRLLVTIIAAILVRARLHIWSVCYSGLQLASNWTSALRSIN